MSAQREPQVLIVDDFGRVALPVDYANLMVIREIRDRVGGEEVVFRAVPLSEKDIARLTKSVKEPTGSQVTSEDPRGHPNLYPSGGESGKLPIQINQTPNGRFKFGPYGICEFLKALGVAQWSVDDASRLLIRLGQLTGFDDLAKVPEKSTVACQVGDGHRIARGEAPLHTGEAAKLSRDQLNGLRKLLSDNA